MVTLKILISRIDPVSRKWKWVLVVVIIYIMPEDFGALKIIKFVHAKEIQCDTIDLLMLILI